MGWLNGRRCLHAMALTSLFLFGCGSGDGTSDALTINDTSVVDTKTADTSSPNDSNSTPDVVVSNDTNGISDIVSSKDTNSGSGVCGRWKADFPASHKHGFTKSGCDPGSISQGSIDDAIRRINLYRWLVGLPPLVEDKNLSKITQACAVLQANNDGPTNTINPHKPPSNWNCYSADGAKGSGSSNLSWGVSSPAGTIAQYIADAGTPSLGHRLWIISPGLDKTGIGMATGSGKWGVASCLYTVGGKGTTKVDFVAYPSPGDFPIQAISGSGHTVRDWSFNSSKYAVSGLTEVTLVRESDGDTQVLKPRKIGSYGHPSGLSFRPRLPVAGETYTVKLGSIYSYKVSFVDCK